MKIQGNVYIPTAKLTNYLLVYRDQDDKSKFLAQAGFTQVNSDQLEAAILQLIQDYDAIADRQNKYGTFYRVEEMNTPSIELYNRVSLNRDFSEYNLKAGDIATLVDTVPDPDGIEEGYVLEIFNVLGESIDTVIVPQSAISSLKPTEIPAIRSLSQV
ncbi:MAG: DUF6883 domain-containing protein [Phormidesmis sp.]